MKHKLQNLLKHKLQWLLLLTVLLGVSQGVWGWSFAFPGSFNDWNEGAWGNAGYGVCLSGGDAVYDFKLIRDNTWFSNSGAGTMTSSDCSNWTMYSSDSNNTNIKSESQGLYIFKVADENTPKISVLYNVVGSNYFKLKFKGANSTEITGNNNKKATVKLGVLTISSSNKLTVDYWNCYWYRQGDGNICNGNGGLRWKLETGIVVTPQAILGIVISPIVPWVMVFHSAMI